MLGKLLDFAEFKVILLWNRISPSVSISQLCDAATKYLRWLTNKEERSKHFWSSSLTSAKHTGVALRWESLMSVVGSKWQNKLPTSGATEQRASGVTESQPHYVPMSIARGQAFNP